MRINKIDLDKDIQQTKTEMGSENKIYKKTILGIIKNITRGQNWAVRMLINSTFGLVLTHYTTIR